MKRVYSIFILCVVAYLLFCAGCMRFRITDSKAYETFRKKKVPLQIFDTSIDKRRLHYVIAGEDSLPTLVFIHGSPGSWSAFTNYLTDPDLLKKFRLMSIDRPGFGYSDFGEPMHLKEQSLLLASVIAAHQNGKDIFLIGHSIGGPIIAQMAAMNPESYRKIVIMAGSISPYLEPKEVWRNILDNTIMNKFLPGAFAPSNTEIRWFKKDLYGLEKELANVRSAVIFIHGEKDKWVPIGNVAYGIKSMTNASHIQSHTLKGADHFIPWKRFEEIKKILLALY